MSSNEFLQNFSSKSSNEMFYDFSYKGRYFRFVLSKTDSFSALKYPVWNVSLFSTNYNYLVFEIVKSWGFDSLFKLNTFFSKSRLKKIKKEFLK